jgi:hypothetical protein
MQQDHQYLPDTNRLSVVTASILLAYALIPFIQLPDRTLGTRIFGILFQMRVNFATIIYIITALMAAAGVSWLLKDHPQLGQQPVYQHWLIPALTALVIGVPLNSLAVGPQWWSVFGFGGLLLVAVLVSEYITVDPYDSRHGPAAIALTAVSYALFLILTITLVAAGSRLYVLVPTLGGAIFLVTLRNLHLRLFGKWYILWSAGITLAIVQVAAALHYWPLSPLRFGLIILGLVYSLPGLVGALEEGRSWQTAWIEPAFMLLVLWGLAFVFRA